MAGCSLCNTELKGAKLQNVKIMNADLQGAKLEKADLLWKKIDWKLTHSWRSAKLDRGVREALIEQYGEYPNKPKVLMLMWEMPPFVSGGGWTAAYHLVRRLRRLGAGSAQQRVFLRAV